MGIRHGRSLRFATCAALVGAFVAGAGVVDAGSHSIASTDVLPRTVVSLGDSFIAGEAGRWQGNSNAGGSGQGTDRSWRTHWIWSWPDPVQVYGSSLHNGCHRSDVAPVTWIDDLGFDAQVNLACSGAVAADIIDQNFKWEAPQAQQLADLAVTHNVDAVLLSIGGNDLAAGGFAEIVVTCVLMYGIDAGDCRHGSSLIPGIEETVAANIDAAVQGIRDSVAAIDAALVDDVDGYRIILMNPMSPVPAVIDPLWASKHRRTNVGRCPLADDDLAYVRNVLVPQTIADAWGSVAQELGVEFVDLSEALAGKEACAPGTRLGSNPATAQWFRFVTINPFFGQVYESAHPNALGQQAIGTCLALQLAQNTDMASACHRSGNTPADMTLVPA